MIFNEKEEQLWSDDSWHKIASFVTFPLLIRAGFTAVNLNTTSWWYFGKAFACAELQAAVSFYCFPCPIRWKKWIIWRCKHKYHCDKHTSLFESCTFVTQTFKHKRNVRESRYECPNTGSPASPAGSGQTSRRASRLCSSAMASAECLHFSEPHWQVKYLLLMSQKRSP